MRMDFGKQAGEAVRNMLGDAVYALLAADRPVSNDAIAAVIAKPGGEQDLAVEFALDMLKWGVPDVLYNEMCRVVGDAVFTLYDHGIESKQIVIADALRTALASCRHERSELLIRAMTASAEVLDR